MRAGLYMLCAMGNICFVWWSINAVCKCNVRRHAWCIIHAKHAACSIHAQHVSCSPTCRAQGPHLYCCGAMETAGRGEMPRALTCGWGMSVNECKCAFVNQIQKQVCTCSCGNLHITFPHMTPEGGMDKKTKNIPDSTSSSIFIFFIFIFIFRCGWFWSGELF